MKKHYTEKLEKLVEERYEIDYRIISSLNKDRNVIDWNKYNGTKEEKNWTKVSTNFSYV